MANLLEGHELVAHVFIAATGPEREAAYRWVVELWHRCADELNIDDPLSPRPDAPPPDAPPATDGLFAARSSRIDGLHQLVLQRSGDVLCLSLLRAPSLNIGWTALDAQWSAVLRPPTQGVLGTVRIAQARLADATAALDLALLGPAVAADSRWTGRWTDGVLRDDLRLCPLAIWEVLDNGQSQLDRDGRADRRVVVLAPQANDAELSAWTWSRGDDALTPFTRYLLHAAKARYELRLWAAAREVTALRDETDRAIAPLLQLATTAAAVGQDPDPDALLAASTTLVELQARELGLVDRASRLRDLRLTVAIAAANMTTHVGEKQDGGLFADDTAMLAWLDRQFRNDLTYLDAATERAQVVTGLADQLVHRGMSRRQERVNLALTGVIGAVLLVLAAIQSFTYSVPIPKAAQPPVIAALGAFALLTSMIALRLAAPRHTAPAVAVCLAAGMLGGALAWTVVSLVAGVTAVAVSGGWAALGGVVGLATAALVVPSR